MCETQPGPVSVVSALAEGADRLVADIVLDVPGASLIAILPDEPSVYETDFASNGSVEQFRAFLQRAEAVSVVPDAGSRHANFEAAGHIMLQRIDVLIALWDGEPARGRGGTAEIVAAARATEMPVLWIETAPPFRVHNLRERTGSVAPRPGRQ